MSTTNTINGLINAEVTHITDDAIFDYCQLLTEQADELMLLLGCNN